MLSQKTSAQEFHSLKPIKEIKLRMFKQIYQKQKSKPNINDRQKSTEPRKSFLNVTRRHSVIDCTQYASVSQLQPSKSVQLNQYNSNNDFASTAQKNKKSPKKGKQNITINRIPIKIRSKRVNSKIQLNKHENKQNKTQYTKKLLQSPFHDDFICIERQSILEQNDQEF